MLRPYQSDLLNKTREAYRNGARAPCIVLPCGGGKSVIVADVAKSATQKGNRVLFLVHRKELVDQIRNTFRRWGVNMNLCDVMMVQTASRRVSELQKPVLIITDENHHSKASTYRKVYDAFPDARRLGVTATPVRLDGSGLIDVNDRLIEGVTAKWLIENNYLAPYEYYAPSIADLSDLKTARGEFETKSVEQALLKKAVFGNVIAHYRKLAMNKQAVCYCVSVKYSEMMAQEFCDAGIKAAHIDGSTPQFLRDHLISEFRSGKIKILCNVDLISEGFDVPDCSCAILLRPTKSLTLYIQQSMRCMRYKPGKTAVIIDHVGNYARFGMPDADRQWTLEGRKKEKRDSTGEDKVKASECPECFYVFETPSSGNTVCPSCGYVFPKKERTVEHEQEVELQKITGFTLDFKSSDECGSMKELQALAEKRGYKPGWVYYQAKKRGWL